MGVTCTWTLRLAATRAQACSISRKHLVSTLLVGVADISFHLYPAGNTVHRSGIDMALADRGAGVHRAGRKRPFFDGEHNLRGGAKGVLAVMHEHASGMTSLAFHADAQSRGRGDAGDNAHGQTFLLQQRTLLDVQFDKRRIVAIVQAHLVEGALEAGRRAQLGQRVAFGIFQARHLRCCPARRPTSGCPGNRGRSAWAPRR